MKIVAVVASSRKFLVFCIVRFVRRFKYSGTSITNQKSISEEIKSRLKSGNSFYHSVQNILSSSLLSKNVKVKLSHYRPGEALGVPGG